MIPRTLLAATVTTVVMSGSLAWGAAAVPPSGNQPTTGPEVAAAPAPVADTPFAPGQAIVSFEKGSVARGHAALAAAGFTTVMDLGGSTPVELVRIPPGLSVSAAVDRLKAESFVRNAQPNYLHTHQATSNDPYWTNGSLWGMQGSGTSPANPFGTGAATAWANGQTGSNQVVVGVIDEGIQVTHPDLAANIWQNPSEANGVAGVDDDGNGFIDDLNGWDFYNNDKTVFDGADDHGTHVSGTIGGVGGNGIGVAGVNWSVKIVSGKFLGPNGGYTSDAIRAINYMIDLKTRHRINLVAINNSWGGGPFESVLLDAINAAGDADILFVVAAGNSNVNTDTSASYPSNYQCTKGGTRGWDCVLSVAAISSTGGRASFSNYGATTVDLGAPGVGITSTVANGYASYDGTSMATPHVTGAIALCESINPTLTARELRDAVIGTVTATSGLQVATGGRLDVAKMAAACQPAAAPPTGTAANLVADPIAATGVVLSWTDSAADEAGFTIERATSVNSVCGTYTSVGRTSANATSSVVTGLTASTDYCFRVTPVNSAGSGTSSTTTARTKAASGPYACNAESYAWTDSTAGTRYALSDDSQVTIPMPFNFVFYDAPVQNVSIASNGFLRMDSGLATQYVNASIPNSADPNGIVAPWWDDLNPGAGGIVSSLVTGAAPNRKLVVSWDNILPFSASDAVSFQVVLDEATGDVTMRYRDAVSNVGSLGSSATIGLENWSGTAGTQVSSNSGTRQSLTAVRCSNRTGAFPVAVTTTSLPSGTVGLAYSATVAASGGTAPYTWQLASGSLPPGLLLASSTGAITGNPTTAGTFSFSISVTDAAATSDTRAYSVVVNAPTLPGAFAKSSPTSGTTGASLTSVTLSWGASTGAARYEYCIDRTAGTTCDGSWISVGTSRSVAVRNLLRLTAYYWQVRAVHSSGGIREANSGTWWQFTTRA